MVVIEANGLVGDSVPYIIDQVADAVMFREIAKIALGIEPETSPAFDGHGGMIRVICAAPGVDELFAIRDRVMETVAYEVGPD